MLRWNLLVSDPRAFRVNCTLVFALRCLRAIQGSIGLITSGEAHSVPVVVFALSSNLFLTTLQFIWVPYVHDVGRFVE